MIFNLIKLFYASNKIKYKKFRFEEHKICGKCIKVLICIEFTFKHPYENLPSIQF